MAPSIQRERPRLVWTSLGAQDIDERIGRAARCSGFRDNLAQQRFRTLIVAGPVQEDRMLLPQGRRRILGGRGRLDHAKGVGEAAESDRPLSGSHGPGGLASAGRRT